MEMFYEEFKNSREYQLALENDEDIDDVYKEWLENNEEYEEWLEDQKLYEGNTYSYYGISEHDFY